MVTIVRNSSLVAALASLFLLASCGGGGTTAGTGGGTNTSGASSTLVLDVQGANFAMSAPGAEPSAGMLAGVSSLLFADAWAQLDDTTQIYLSSDGGLTYDLVVATIIDGDAYLVLDPGIYIVCLNAAGDTDPSDDDNCEQVTIEADQVIVVTGEPDGSGGFVLGNATEAPSVEAYRDPDFANKTIICHKGRMTLSVGTPAALNGHTVHGDSLGPCPEAAPGGDGEPLVQDQNTNTGNNGNNGNKGNNGNNGNNGNRPS